MDVEISEPTETTEKTPDAIVLSCVSERYCEPQIERIGGRSVLLTRRLIYPGAFLFYDAIEAWRTGGSLSKIRGAAGRAYAKNQGISVRAGSGIFSDLKSD